MLTSDASPGTAGGIVLGQFFVGDLEHFTARASKIGQLLAQSDPVEHATAGPKVDPVVGPLFGRFFGSGNCEEGTYSSLGWGASAGEIRGGEQGEGLSASLLHW